MNDYLNCDLSSAAIKPLLKRLISLHEHVKHLAEQRLTDYAHYLANDKQRSSTVNLTYSLALRSIDLHEIEQQLVALGFSSLNKNQYDLADNLNRVIALLCDIVGEKIPNSLSNEYILNYETGKQLLRKNTEMLLGKSYDQHEVRMMITLPSTAADDYEFVKNLIEAGMNCARINCANGIHTTWKHIINNVQRAIQETGKPCRIMMDLAGQKIRTGKIEPGPAIYHLKVKRDEFGKVISPGYLQIVKQSQYHTSTNSNQLKIGIDDEIHSDLEIGDRLNLVDNRGKHRYLEIVERSADNVILTRCWQSTYLSDKTVFQLRRNGSRKTQPHHLDIRISVFQAAPAKIRVFMNDIVILTSADSQGRALLRAKDGALLQPAQIGISHECILDQLKPGETIWFDSGKIGTVIEDITEQGARLRVTHARAKGSLIRTNKNIHFPDTELDLPALTAEDLQDLDFICQYADIIGYSYVQEQQDMERLAGELDKRNAHDLPIIAKIETTKAIKNLPEIILSTLGHTTLGVMIARDELAVELGSARITKAQQEISCLCRAAYVPVILTTQSLERLTKDDTHSRPDMSDAVMSIRAECIMLNKGPYMLNAVTALNKILVQMQEYRYNETSQWHTLLKWDSLKQSPEDKREQLAS